MVLLVLDKASFDDDTSVLVILIMEQSDGKFLMRQLIACFDLNAKFLLLLAKLA